MKQYILKLKTTSTTNYAVYDGTTALTDAELTTLFTTAGSAYFNFDFDSLTPSATDAITIVNSSDTAVITNTGLTDTIVETKDFKGTWSASATTFDTFTALGGVSMDEAQLSDLMGKIKDAGGVKEVIVPSSSVETVEQFLSHFEGGSLPVSGIYKVTIQGSGWHYVSGLIQLYAGSTYIMLISATSVTNVQLLLLPRIINANNPNDTYQAMYFSKTSAADPTKVKMVQVNDTLTSTSEYLALSAAQGKVLADRIGDLTTLTTTDKTSTVAAINEVNAVITSVGFVTYASSSSSSTTQAFAGVKLPGNYATDESCVLEILTAGNDSAICHFEARLLDLTSVGSISTIHTDTRNTSISSITISNADTSTNTLDLTITFDQTPYGGVGVRITRTR